MVSAPQAVDGMVEGFICAIEVACDHNIRRNYARLEFQNRRSLMHRDFETVDRCLKNIRSENVILRAKLSRLTASHSQLIAEKIEAML
jgi:hypothetical protein